MIESNNILDSSPSIDILMEQAKKLDTQMIKLLGKDKYYGITSTKKKDKIERLSTGIFSLDEILGGGIPVGRIIELYGPESTAKSAILQHIAGEFQNQGKLVAYLDIENALDPSFSACLGFDLDRAAVMDQLESLEEALEAVRSLVKSGCISLIGVDSICGVPPLGTQERKVGEETMALAARLISRHLPEIAKEAAKNNCTIILINQIRSSLKLYGPSDVTPGGNAIKFTASIRLKTSKREVLKVKGKEIGILLNIQAVKNKCGVPFGSKDFRFLFPYISKDGEVAAGIDKITDLVSYAIELNVIAKSGSWFKYKDHKVQGEDALVASLSADDLLNIKKDLQDAIRNRVLLSDSSSFSSEEEVCEED